MNRTSAMHLLLVAAFCSASAGCTSTVTYQGRSPIAISGEARPPRMSKRALKAALKNKRIEITERVQFELDQAIIKPESHGLLNDVAQVIKENPQITRIRVEGHASADGDDAHNLDLSDRRAKAVRDYLVGQGIDPNKLWAQGFGEQRPIADNNTQEGREKNRRVEFHVDEALPTIPAPPVMKK